jgi:hypothetical protein
VSAVFVTVLESIAESERDRWMRNHQKMPIGCCFAVAAEEGRTDGSPSTKDGIQSWPAVLCKAEKHRQVSDADCAEHTNEA